MEEYVGNLWDQWITRTALGRHPEAVVWLSEVEKSVGILFRAVCAVALLGGNDSFQINKIYSGWPPLAQLRIKNST